MGSCCGKEKTEGKPPIDERTTYEKLNSNQISVRNMNPNDETTETNDRKGSFGHRVYDDLCGDLLHWLSFEDKIKLSSVSKQFNRCLETLWRQKVLDLKELCRPGQKQFNYRELSEIFQRCSNVREIRSPGWSESKLLSEDSSCDVLKFITALATNIESIQMLRFNRIEAKSLMNFGVKFGPTLRSLEIEPIHEISYDSFKCLLKASIKLESLTLRVDSWKRIQDFIFETKDNVQSILIRNLKKLEIGNCWTPIDSKQLTEIVDTNGCLNHLEISLEIKNLIEARLAISKICELKELTHLKIRYQGSTNNRMADISGFIAKNLNKLKVFRFSFSKDETFDSQKFFKGFKNSSSLKSFDFFRDMYSASDTFNFDIECFRNCQQLTDLKIWLNETVITSEFFWQISCGFDYLKKIDLWGIFFEVKDEDLRCLSKLKNLEYLKLDAYKPLTNCSFTDSGIISLVRDSKKLYSFGISLDLVLKVTENLLKEMIEKALENPESKYSYFFLYYNYEDEQLPNIANEKPLSNLSIRYRYL